MVKTFCSLLICLVLQRNLFFTFQIQITIIFIFILPFSEKNIHPIRGNVSPRLISVWAPWLRFTVVLVPVCPPVDLRRVGLPLRQTPLLFLPPPPSHHAFPSTRVDITMEARRGLLICSQLHPYNLLYGKDLKLSWNREEQPKTSRKQSGDEVHHRWVWQGVDVYDTLLQINSSPGLRDIIRGRIMDVEM